MLRLDEAQRHVQAVLHELKRERLEQKALLTMKVLEETAVNLEVVKMAGD